MRMVFLLAKRLCSAVELFVLEPPAIGLFTPHCSAHGHRIECPTIRCDPPKAMAIRGNDKQNGQYF
jgi:hypothetical protein